MNTPILYSFRRCPYCIRAHMALKYSGQKIILRAVELRDLPAEVLAVSAQATVPALVLSDNESMDQSWDIVKWALEQNDPDNWLGEGDHYLQAAERLVEQNDSAFKQDLDRYKYADRYPEQTMEHYRQQCELFLVELNGLLVKNSFLLADTLSVADVAVLPFIRQFSMVDKDWYEASPYPALQRWLKCMLETRWFGSAFEKHVIWTAGDENIYI